MTAAPQHPYWPLTPDSWIEYCFLRWDGGYNPHDMSIGIDGTTRHPEKSFWTSNEFMRTTCVPSPINAQIPCTMRVNTERGAEPQPGMSFRDKCLYNGAWNEPGKPDFIGEIGSPDFVCIPPLPIITARPIAGEEFTGTAKYAGVNPATGLWFQGETNYRYRTLSVGQSWGQWPDVVRTALEERPEIGGGANDMVYNYVFARGVGLVDSWWGERQAGNAISRGYQLYGVAHS